MPWAKKSFFLNNPTTTIVVTEIMDTAHRLILGPQSESSLSYVLVY